MPEQKRKPTPEERIEALKKRKEQLNKQIAAAEAREKAKDKKEDIRLKILIGSVILADLKSLPNLKEKLKPFFEKHITNERDRAFLIEKGWIVSPDKKATSEANAREPGAEARPLDVQ
jgi:hypothetical protein